MSICICMYIYRHIFNVSIEPISTDYPLVVSQLVYTPSPYFARSDAPQHAQSFCDRSRCGEHLVPNSPWSARGSRSCLEQGAQTSVYQIKAHGVSDQEGCKSGRWGSCGVATGAQTAELTRRFLYLRLITAKAWLRLIWPI